jgi:hypothetical protein
MAFIEEGEVAYTMINGKKVPVVKCETEVVLRNKETNVEYNSDAELELIFQSQINRQLGNKS